MDTCCICNTINRQQPVIATGLDKTGTISPHFYKNLGGLKGFPHPQIGISGCAQVILSKCDTVVRMLYCAVL